MGDSSEDKGFTVNDRRINFDEEKAGGQASAEAAATSSEKAEGHAPVDGPGWKMEGKAADKAEASKELPAMDFSHLCLSMASSALICLGEAPNPESGKVEANIPLARQTIDILAMLEEKTRGNLTADESKLLSTILYDLRMRFLQRKNG